MRVIFFIDRINAYAKYGVFVERYGYKQLVQMPKLKKVESNDWLDQDGIEVDLSSPQLDTRTLSINFFCDKGEAALEFIEMLSSKVYHQFYFPEIKRAYKLRLISETSKKINISTQKFTLSFANDFPFAGYEYEEPKATGVLKSGYKLDNVNFAEYGVLLLEGTDDSVLKSPEIKPSFVVNNSDMNGALYAGQKLEFRERGTAANTQTREEVKTYYKAKDATLKCLLNIDLDTFWRNYNALFWNLSRPNLRSFCVNRIGVYYPCYYVGMSVTKFDVLTTGRVWCEFSITLKFTRFRWYAPFNKNVRLNSDSTPRFVLSNGNIVLKLINK